MTPQEQERLRIVESIVFSLAKSDRFTFERLIQILDGRNVQLGLTTGTKLGTSASQKLGLWNTTPVDQPAALSDVPTGGSATAAQNATAINLIHARLREPGIIAT